MDFELQKNYRPGYPVIKRGIYYGCRKLSSQLDKVGKNGKGYKYLEKVYSIWICLDNIPKEQQNTVSYYKIHNYKNEGFRVPDIQIDAAEADLMEVVIVRLGGEAQNEKGLMDLLYGVFSGDQKKVLSYIPDSDSQIRQKEVSDMLSMISYAEERGEKKGEKKGIKKGENRLGMLMKILLDNKRYADAKRASEDEIYREQKSVLVSFMDVEAVYESGEDGQETYQGIVSYVKNTGKSVRRVFDHIGQRLFFCTKKNPGRDDRGIE